MSGEKHDIKQETRTSHEEVPCCCSQRWILAYVGFFGFMCVYALRVNFSMAVLCMIKPANDSSSAIVSNTSQMLGAGCIESTSSSIISEHAEFDWSRSTRSSMLASFFYGYICTQFIGGWLSDRYGGRRVLGIALLIASICTVILPVCARSSYILVYALRVILGLATAVSFPSAQSIWGRWAPPLERSKLISVTYIGTTLGNVVTFSTAGLLCQYGFDNGWASIFYVTGGFTFIWVLFWFYLSADTPRQHPRITDVEREYIEKAIEYDTSKRTLNVPWLAMLKSKALWACLVAHVCNNWTNYTLLTSLPTFMKEVHKFDIKSNGVLSAVPYICQWFSGVISGQTADIIRSKGWLNTTNTRKLYQVTSFLAAGALLIATGFTSCEHRNVAVVLLSLAVLFTGLCRAGYVVNHVDFAPKYAGILYGITNTVATIPGMVAPIVAGALTPNKTQSEWRNVFYVCAGMDVFGALVFGLFASGQLEDWAKDEVELEYTANTRDLDHQQTNAVIENKTDGSIEMDKKEK